MTPVAHRPFLICDELHSYIGGRPRFLRPFRSIRSGDALPHARPEAGIGVWRVALSRPSITKLTARLRSAFRPSPADGSGPPPRFSPLVQRSAAAAGGRCAHRDHVGGLQQQRAERPADGPGDPGGRHLGRHLDRLAHRDHRAEPRVRQGRQGHLGRGEGRGPGDRGTGAGHDRRLPAAPAARPAAGPTGQPAGGAEPDRQRHRRCPAPGTRSARPARSWTPPRSSARNSCRPTSRRSTGPRSSSRWTRRRSTTPRSSGGSSRTAAGTRMTMTTTPRPPPR